MPESPASPWGVDVIGWLRSDAPGQFRDPAVVAEPGITLRAAFLERPDVPTKGGSVTGFRCHVGTPDLAAGEKWQLRYLFDGIEQRHDLPLPLADDSADALAFAAAKERKLARLASIVVCPVHRRPLTERADGLWCRRCHRAYPVGRMRYDFMPDRELGADLRSTDNVSSLGYDPVAEELIQQCAGGLVLDNGAGLRDRYRDDVVNLEIVDFPTTDVLGTGQRLPFRDDSFDGVLSIAVLEHVRDPFACAAEIHRVLKPGGQAYVAVPFLQPFHGYPDHYYNMTTSGLRNLFEDRFHVHDVGQPPGGAPFFAISWMLESYARGLPAKTRERFLDLPVRALLGDDGRVLKRDYVRHLSSAAREELACGNYILLHKR
jgi:SAM-dependent methyltransferase